MTLSDSRFYRLRRLNMQWWMFLLAAGLPWLGMAAVPQWFEWPPMPLFIFGLLLFFVVLKRFAAYKKALWAMAQTDEQGEDQRWQTLAQTQRSGLLLAAAPAWWAALTSPFGLDGAAGLLLVLGSLITLWLFRVPAQVLAP